VSVHLQEVAEANQWHGWGLDNNTLCPSTQISTTQELLCEPGYPGAIEQTKQSWTGVTCTPNGHVVCLTLPGYGLSGNMSSLVELAPLKDMQCLNLANNSLQGVFTVMMQHPWHGSSTTGLHEFNIKCQILRRPRALWTVLAAGSLPADLPTAFHNNNFYSSALAVVYLSNNSISGTLPAEWGDPHVGWRTELQRLYLSDNQLTGQLPDVWSDGNSLYDLGRLDLFGNAMTGSLPWTQANMPSLGNLVLLPGVHSYLDLHLDQKV